MTGCQLIEHRDHNGALTSRSIMCRVRTEDEIMRGLAESVASDYGDDEWRHPDRDDFADPPDSDVDFDDHDVDEDGLPADPERDDGHDLPWGMSILRLDDELMDSDDLGSGVLGNHHRIRDRLTIIPDDTSDL